MIVRNLGIVFVVMSFAVIAGCANGVFPGTSTDPTLAVVAAKAETVAETVGGPNGFGGMLMTGYVGHMPLQLGFTTSDDLAQPGATMTVTLRNDSDRDGTFHLFYFAGHMGLVDQSVDVDVPAGAEASVEIPCPEIVGMGPLDEPGEAGCHLADGESVDNVMAVPGFLGEDFTCDGVYEYVLTPDIDDLDGDGDTEELIILSDAMEFHMTNDGPTGHTHGDGTGMMGSHMGF